MPRNKEALIRYRVINRCLVNGKVASLEKLQRECELELGEQHIGKRTIQEDIRDMREDERLGYNAPVKFDRNRGGYCYSDPDYTIDKIPLNEEELAALAFSATMLSQFRNVEMFACFTGAVQKITDAINIHRLVQEQAEFDFIQFENVPFIKGSEYIQPIIDAIRNRVVLNITYQAFYSEESKTAFIHPYLLKEYRHRWYVIGLNDEYRELRTYALDRILELKVSGKAYLKQGLNPKEYFRNTIGVTSPGTEPPDIKISVKKPQAQYLVTLPIHESQEIVEEGEDELILQYKVHPTYEFIALMLSLGSQVKILEPESLVSEVNLILKNALKQYKG